MSPRSARLAIPATAELVTATAALLGAPAGASMATRRGLASEAGQQYVETVIGGFVLALAAAARGRPAGVRLAALVRGFAERGLRGAIADAGPDDLDALGGFLTERLMARFDHDAPAIAPRGAAGIDHHPATLVAFVIDDELGAALAPALTATRAGQPPAAGALAVALHALVDHGLRHLLDDVVEILRLGFVTRKAAALGRGAIVSRAHGAVDEALGGPDADAAALRLAEFLGRSVVPAPFLAHVFAARPARSL